MSDALREALAASGVGALIAKEIDENLLEYQRRYAPFVRVTPTVPWDTDQYFFNKRTARPRGGFVQDGGARPVTNSTYTQSSFRIRLLQSVGAVTGFAQAVTRGVIGDLKQREIDGAIQGLLWDIETAMIWGSEPATANAATGVLGQYPQFTGVAFLVNNFGASGASGVNAIDEAHAVLTLAMLDQIKDQVENAAAMPVMGEQYMWVMGSRAKTKVDQLIINQQRYIDTQEVAAGLLANSYAGIPIIKSSMLAGRSAAGPTLGTVTTAQDATYGSIAAGVVRYQVSAVMEKFGETVASVETGGVVTVGAGGKGENTIPITAPADPQGEGNLPLLYLVYATAVGGGAGTEVLIGVVDAYDTTGAAVTNIIDTGTALWTNSRANSVNPTAYVGAPASGSLGPRANFDEDIFLLPRDEDFLVRPFVRDVTPLPLSPTTSAPDTLPFALVTDTCVALRGPKYVGRLARVLASI